MKNTTESKQVQELPSTPQSIGIDAAPYWSKSGGKCPQFDPTRIPEELFGEHGYFGLVASTDDEPFTCLTDFIPEKNLLLIVSKGSLSDAFKEGLRGFEFCLKSDADGNSVPIVRIANRFDLEARGLLRFIGSASALGGIPVFFVDANAETFMVRYAFGTDAFIALHKLGMEKSALYAPPSMC